MAKRAKKAADSDMVKVRLYVSIGLSGANREEEIEVPREEWEAMSEKEREEFGQEQLFNILDWSWSVVD